MSVRKTFEWLTRILVCCSMQFLLIYFEKHVFYLFIFINLFIINILFIHFFVCVHEVIKI